MEELRAELSSVFLAGELGIPANIPNHASYINGWLKPLKDDKREIFRAAADAQRIVDTILGFHPDFALRTQAERKPENAQSIDQPTRSVTIGMPNATPATLPTPSHG
jgi:antirestriction protein ArdC